MFDLSIFIPTHYSGARHYSAILQAISLANTNSNIEVIVSDNSGDDNKFNFLKMFDCVNVKVVKGPKEKNNFYALSLATGKYVFLMGDDDTLLGASFSALISKLKNNPEFIGVTGMFAREMKEHYDFFPAKDLGHAKLSDRIKGLIGTIPIGNPLLHIILKRDVAIDCYKFWSDIPNVQGYHDHAVTLYLLCRGPILMADTPFFIYNFTNWRPDSRVESEIRQAEYYNTPKSVILIQRLFIAYEGFCIISRNGSPDGAAMWFSRWYELWMYALKTDYQELSRFVECKMYVDVNLVIKKFFNKTDVDISQLSASLAKLNKKINNTDNQYLRFWNYSPK